MRTTEASTAELHEIIEQEEKTQFNLRRKWKRSVNLRNGAVQEIKARTMGDIEESTSNA